MARLRRFLGLSMADRRLVLQALIAVASTRAVLPLLSFRRVHAFVLGRSRATSGRAPIDVARVGWAVRAASRVVPGASCLTQAFAAQLLLARSGVPSELQIGVARSPGERLRAHAWVMAGETIVVGGEERRAFTQLRRESGRSDGSVSVESRIADAI